MSELDIERARFAVKQADERINHFSQLKRGALSVASIAYKLEIEKWQEEKTKRLITLANLLIEQLEAAV